ncbi:MAG: hypothetical protein ACYS15_11900 [Planctomycetota bacterium]|jgi:hypothetical protein
MTTQVGFRSGVGASSRERRAGCLRALWDIGEESFRTLVNARYRPVPASGVTDEDRRLPMLGDALIARPSRVSMRVVEIDQDAEAVWPWLAQMMRGGGIYGWPALETARCRSADYLLDDLAPPRIGDRVDDVFELADVDAPMEIVWTAPAGLELVGLRVRALTIDYLLRPGSCGGCRLVVRTRGCCERLTSQVRGYLCELVDFLLPAHQVETIRGHVGSYADRRAIGQVNRELVGRHQAVALERGAGVTPAGLA